MSENTFLVIVWALVLGSLLAIVFMLNYYWDKDLEYYTANGYCEVQQLGTNIPRWTKCKE